MNFIPHSQIIVGDRQRKSFDKHTISELALSIETKGLLHPIVLRYDPLDDTVHLVAGERRLRAMKLLHSEKKLFTCNALPVPMDSVPYTSLHVTDDIAIREAELDENIKRVDLTWQEHVAAIDELHSLRLARNPSHSVTETARELVKTSDMTIPSAKNKVHRALILAEMLEHPDVGGVKDEPTAYKNATRIIHNQLAQELRRRSVAAPSAHTLHHGDMLQFFPAFASETFDCIIADPPYGLGFHEHDKIANLDHHYDDSPANALAISSLIITEGMRVTVKDAHLYLFCDIENFPRLHALACLNGWFPFRTPLVWIKSGASGHTPFGLRGFRRNYELILFAYKGDKQFPSVTSDTFIIPEVRGKIHAAQKPPELYTALLSGSCVGGMKVLDPCCGSGTIFHSAKQLGLVATGIEMDGDAYASAKEAMEE